MSDQRSKVAWFPKTVDLTGNPYWAQLQSALEALGIEFESSHASYWLTRRWLLKHRRDVDILHFHFIQPFYAGKRNSASLRRLLKFMTDLFLARMLGYHIVWTMHDLMPTWPKAPIWVEEFARYIIAWLAQDVIVHCNEAQRLLAKNFGRKRNVHILFHPNYIDVYPNSISSEETRRELNIELDKFVYAFIGGIRPNKGIDELISAFSQIEDERIMLLIAGKPWPPEDYLKELQDRVLKDNRICFYPQEISDAEMQIFLNTADVIVLPFKNVLTSGSVILAMGFGRPVIVPNKGCLSEIVGSDAGIVYDCDDSSALTRAMRQAYSSDLKAMGRCAAQKIDIYTWENKAKETVNIYRRNTAYY